MIKIENLTKRYGSRTVFDGASAVFPDTGLICLLGPSGSGKSTLFNLIAGFDTDYQGTIIANGHILSTLSEDELCAWRRDEIGFIFQNYCLLENRSAVDNIVFAQDLHPQMENQEEEAQFMLDHMNIGEKADENVSSLSGGEKQRVAAARALMYDAKLILADEPTGALDRKSSDQVMGMLQLMSKNRLVLVITHDEKICRYADHVYRVKDGQIFDEQQEEHSESESLLNADQSVNSKQDSIDNDQLTKENLNTAVSPSPMRMAKQNTRIYLKKWVTGTLLSAIVIALAILSLVLLQIQNVYIDTYLRSSAALNAAYIRTDDPIDQTRDLLTSNEYTDNVHYQYVIHDVALTMNGKRVDMNEKYPMPRCEEQFSSGKMPKMGKNEIVLSPSLARKFSDRIQELYGQTVYIEHAGTSIPLHIVGIFNAGYDDFYASSDIEQQMYRQEKSPELYALSFDVTRTSKLPEVIEMLEEQGISVQSAIKEVNNMLNSFNRIATIFKIASIVLSILSLISSCIVVSSFFAKRKKEFALMSACGFTRTFTRRMIRIESLFGALIALGTGAASGVIAGGIIARIYVPYYPTDVWFFPVILVTALISCLWTVLAAFVSNQKVLKLQPAEALRK